MCIVDIILFKLNDGVIVPVDPEVVVDHLEHLHDDDDEHVDRVFNEEGPSSLLAHTVPNESLVGIRKTVERNQDKQLEDAKQEVAVGVVVVINSTGVGIIAFKLDVVFFSIIRINILTLTLTPETNEQG